MTRHRNRFLERLGKVAELALSNPSPFILITFLALAPLSLLLPGVPRLSRVEDFLDEILGRSSYSLVFRPEVDEAMPDTLSRTGRPQEWRLTAINQGRAAISRLVVDSATVDSACLRVRGARRLPFHFTGLEPGRTSDEALRLSLLGHRPCTTWIRFHMSSSNIRNRDETFTLIFHPSDSGGNRERRHAHAHSRPRPPPEPGSGPRGPRIRLLIPDYMQNARVFLGGLPVAPLQASRIAMLLEVPVLGPTEIKLVHGRDTCSRFVQLTGETRQVIFNPHVHCRSGNPG